MPGDYVVTVQHAGPTILPKFSEEDLKVVDDDFETSFSAGAPLPVIPGASLSVGTITARKMTYYRAHLSVQSGDCAPGQTWSFSANSQTAGFGFPVPCGKEFLVRNLAPGSYSFTLSTNGRSGEKRLWGVTPVKVADHNLEVSMTMSAGADISGRIVAADGTTLPSGKTTILVTPELSGLGTTTLVSDPGGRFLIAGLPGGRSRLSVSGMSRKFYVKEIRYNGLAVADDVITLIAGAPAELEIVIDDKAATISGSVAERDKVTDRIMVVAMKWPVPADATSLSALLNLSNSVSTDDQGRFQIGGLAPGEYRVLALTGDTLIRNGDRLSQLAGRGEKVTVERESSQNVSLKIVEP
jgi:hypothetical protein